MLDDAETARRLRLAVDDVEAALVRLRRIDDPSLWTGPAAGAFGAVLDTHLRRLRPLLDAIAAGG